MAENTVAGKREQQLNKEAKMPRKIFQRTYPLNEEYEGIKQRAFQKLDKYLAYPDRKVRHFLLGETDPHCLHKGIASCFSSQTLTHTPFNKGIFNLVSRDRIGTYVERIKAGELIRSQLKGMDRAG